LVPAQRRQARVVAALERDLARERVALAGGDDLVEEAVEVDEPARGRRGAPEVEEAFGERGQAVDLAEDDVDVLVQGARVVELRLQELRRAPDPAERVAHLVRETGRERRIHAHAFGSGATVEEPERVAALVEEEHDPAETSPAVVARRRRGADRARAEAARPA